MGGIRYIIGLSVGAGLALALLLQVGSKSGYRVLDLIDAVLGIPAGLIRTVSGTTPDPRKVR